MQKAYREFWNNKAEELCSTSALKSFKPGEIQGAINVAWTIKKTEFLTEQKEKVNKEVVFKCPVDLLKKFQLLRTTLKKNTERVETAESSSQNIQGELASARQEFFDVDVKEFVIPLFFCERCLHYLKPLTTRVSVQHRPLTEVREN